MPSSTTDKTTNSQGLKSNQKLPAIEKFLLKEYENVWGLFRANYEIRDRWAKFYFLAVGSTLAFLGALFKAFENKAPASSDINPNIALVIAGILIFLFLLGLTVLSFEVGLRFSRREMYNVFNFIRRAFRDKASSEKGKDWGNYMYYPVTPQLKSFGWREWAPTLFLLIMVSINFGFLVWFFTLKFGLLKDFFNWSLCNPILLGVLSGLVALAILIYIFTRLDRREYKKTITKIIDLGWGEDLRTLRKDITKKRYAEIIDKLLEEPKQEIE